MIIGFTGKRHVGKSSAADVLEEIGFVRAHAFGAGKAAAKAYFIHVGAAPSVAHEMAYGRLRDVPSPLLPGNAHPRAFLEELGYWAGTHMGPEWTLGMELRKIKRERPFSNIVAESVVYEEPLLRAWGGMVVRIVRPRSDGPSGMRTDEAEADIEADVEIVNNGSKADLKAKVLALL
ncbi:MAG: hypothetical protein JNL14_16010 [Devosia sp.]|uniref:hypothetical protein n=1 Tax=Devosia sp. TaxID=1871048 RepID=UPI001A4453D0|nr:hypothetical protein [Devosia sp.]MBL8599238.1 hypothetical protein [Devosia sp.]